MLNSSCFIFCYEFAICIYILMVHLKLYYAIIIKFLLMILKIIVIIHSRSKLLKLKVPYTWNIVVALHKNVSLQLSGAVLSG